MQNLGIQDPNSKLIGNDGIIGQLESADSTIHKVYISIPEVVIYMDLATWITKCKPVIRC